MLKIRFQRTGRTNDATFRIVVLESERAAKTGAIVEQLGTYNPHSKAVTLNGDRVTYWLSVGAQATGSIHNLLVSQGIISGAKINVLPKKTPPVKEESAPVAPATPEAPASANAEAPAVEPPSNSEAPSEAEVAAEAEPAPEATPALEEAVPEVASEETPAEAPTA